MSCEDRMKQRILLLLFCLSSSLLSSACSFEKLAADNMVPVLQKARTSFNKSGNLRAARQAAPGMLVLLDGISASSPENTELLTLKAELNATFAFGFVEDEYRAAERDYETKLAGDLKAYANELYFKAQAAAMEALKVDDESLAGVIKTGDAKAIAAALKEADAELLPGVFWYAFALGAYANLNRELGSDVTKEAPRVKAMMQWVIDTDETYFHGGAHLFFAMLNLSLGKSIGGQPEVALKHLKEVDRITGQRLLLSKVIYAEFYLPQVQTPSGKVTERQRRKAAITAVKDYIKTLEDVMAAKDDLWPEQRLLNRVAKQRAENLYYMVEDKFIVPAGAKIKIPQREEDDDDEDEDDDE